MKKLILSFILFFLIFSLSAQNSAYNKKIYQDYGTWMVKDGENMISISAFCTVEIGDPNFHENKGVQYRELKQEKIVKPKIICVYELYMVSKSVYEGDTTNTWLYGTKIFVNGKYVLENQFPDGFVISIKTEPTLIHTHRSTNTNMDFDIKWEKSVYEPRIRK